jgi:hypothetical protein
LCLLWRLEMLHLPLSSSRRLMRHFSAVIGVSALAVLDARQQKTPSTIRPLSRAGIAGRN